MIAEAMVCEKGIWDSAWDKNALVLVFGMAAAKIESIIPRVEVTTSESKGVISGTKMKGPEHEELVLRIKMAMTESRDVILETGLAASEATARVSRTGMAVAESEGVILILGMRPRPPAGSNSKVGFQVWPVADAMRSLTVCPF